MNTAVLDNPIWSALTTTQAHLAECDGEARRFPIDVSPMCALPSESAAGYASLARMVGPDGVALLLIDAPKPLLGGWNVLHARDIGQMLHPGDLAPPDPAIAARIVPLGPDDVHDMTALVDMTKPGPFAMRTIVLGDYIGIREGGALIAMAGVRMRPAGFSEISAVCVHPDWQGRGLGKAMTQAVGAVVRARGEAAFLHLKTENVAALRAYEALGFRLRRNIHMRVLRHPRERVSPGGS